MTRGKTNPDEIGHQAISKISTRLEDGEVVRHVITMSAGELFSVLYCAAAHAQNERMYRTADRLFNDADLIRALAKTGPITVEVTT